MRCGNSATHTPEKADEPFLTIIRFMQHCPRLDLPWGCPTLARCGLGLCSDTRSRMTLDVALASRVIPFVTRPRSHFLTIACWGFATPDQWPPGLHDLRSTAERASLPVCFFFLYILFLLFKIFTFFVFLICDFFSRHVGPCQH